MMPFFEQRNLLQKIILLIFLILTLLLTVFLLMNYSGYCNKERRYLTEQELINSAVSRLDIFRSQRRIYLGERTAVTTPALYKDLASFYELNPNCCQLVETIPGEGRPWKLSVFKRLSGRQHIVVKAKYIIGYDINSPSVAIYGESYLLIDSCGEAKQNEY